MTTVDRIMHLADNFASLHRYSSDAESGKARAALHDYLLSTAQPKQEPLADEQIELAYRELYRNEAFGQTTYEMVEAGIRYAEKHHGIGDKT